MRTCPICNKEILRDDAQFCPHCGKSLAISAGFCKNCGNALSPENKFCPRCGTPTSEAKAARVCSRCGNELAEGHMFCPKCGNRFGEEASGRKADREPLDSDGTITVQSYAGHGKDNAYRDYKTKKNDEYSLYIGDTKANDIRIIKKYNVMPDTFYYVRADVKTQGVKNQENSDTPVGANISAGHYNLSRSVLGTEDWSTVGVLARSDYEGNLEISFNLGYFCNTCSGKCWFENIRITPAEELIDEDNTWRFLAIVVTEAGIDVHDKEENRRIKLSHKMSGAERQAILRSLRGFERDLNADAEGLFNADVSIIESTLKLTEFSKGGCGYYVSGSSAAAYIKRMGIDISSYDHVIMIACLPSLPANYYGLGGGRIDEMRGFSFIFHANADQYVDYLNGYRENSWPSAIYTHEFMHSVEWLSNTLGLPVPPVDGERPGYSGAFEYRDWYRDFMHRRIYCGGGAAGLDPRIWSLRPSLFD